MYYNPLKNVKLPLNQEDYDNNITNYESGRLAGATQEDDRYALQENLKAAPSNQPEMDDKQVKTMDGGLGESPNSMQGGLESLRDLARNNILSASTTTTRNISPYLPRVQKKDASGIRDRFFSTRDDLQRRAREASAPVQEIANKRRDSIQSSQDDAKEAMRKAILAKGGARILSTLGAAADKMGTTPFGRPDNSAIHKNIEQTGEDIMQGAREQEKSAKQTFQDYLMAQQAANQLALAPVQEQGMIDKAAKDAMGTEFDLNTLEQDLEGKELNNMLKKAQYANLLAPKESSTNLQMDKFNLSRRNNIIDGAGKASMGMSKDWKQFNDTTSLVPLDAKGNPDFSKMDQGRASLFATNISKMLNGGNMSDKDVDRSLGKVGIANTLAALTNPGASAEEKEFAGSEVRRLFTGSTVNKAQLKNLYELMRGKEKALNKNLDDIIHQYSSIGAATSDYPYEYYSGILKNSLRTGAINPSSPREEGNMNKKQGRINVPDQVEVVSLDDL